MSSSKITLKLKQKPVENVPNIKTDSVSDLSKNNVIGIEVSGIDIATNASNASTSTNYVETFDNISNASSTSDTSTAKKTINLTKKSSQRIAKKDKQPPPQVQVQSNDNERRTKIRLKFIDLLGENLGTECENCLYQHIYFNNKCTLTDRENDKEYLELGLTLYRNLNPNGTIKNTYLLPLVMNGKIKPDELVKMDPKDLLPAKWSTITEKRINEILVESKQEVATTDMVECKKCHHYNATYYQLQVRCADEPMTTFFNCVNCGNKWSEN